MRKSTILGGGCALMLLCAGQAMAQTTPIALSGAAFGAGVYGPAVSGSSFSLNQFSAFSIANGKVLFGSNMDTNPAKGLWIWNGSSNALQMLSTDTPLGGVGAYSASTFLGPILNTAGALSFRDGTATTGGVYTTAGTPGRVISVGASATGVTGATFLNWGTSIAFNNAGQTAAYATITGGTPAVVTTGVTADNTGFWAGTPGSVSLLIRQNAATTDAGARVGAISSGSVGTGFTFTNSGKLLIANILQGTSPDVITATGATQNSRALLSTRSGSLELVARQGKAFPTAAGTPVVPGATTDAAVYNVIATGASGSDMNDAGRLVFTSSLKTAAGATPTTNGTAAIFSDHTDGTLRTLARHTEALPASTGIASASWGSLFGRPLINGSNTVLFTNSSMTGPSITVNTNDAGLFKSNSSGVITTVMRAGDPAPASSASVGNPAQGQNVGTVLFSSAPSEVVMNSVGQIAFISNLAGTGVYSGAGGNNIALFALDADGTQYLVAQKGMNFEVAPGDFRVVKSILLAGSSGGQDGRTTSLDEMGNLVFSLDFWDTYPTIISGEPIPSATLNGLYVFHIPAPGSAGLLALGGLAAARRRRR